MYSIYELNRIQQICCSNIKIDAIMLGKIRQKLLANTVPKEVSAAELICPICDRLIPSTQKDAHHFVPKSKGGKATEYLHRICHRQIHALFTETQLARELNTAEAIREKAEIQKLRQAGKNVLLEIEINGAKQVMAKATEPGLVTIFLMPPSFEALEARIRKRKTESEMIIQERLAKARREMNLHHDYQYLVVNDDVEKTSQQIIDIIKERMLTMQS